MKKTAIGMAIEHLEYYRQQVGAEHKSDLNYAINHLYTSLPTEREQIEEAYNKGYDDANKVEYNNDYYTSTYSEPVKS